MGRGNQLFHLLLTFENQHELQLLALLLHQLIQERTASHYELQNAGNDLLLMGLLHEVVMVDDGRLVVVDQLSLVGDHVLLFELFQLLDEPEVPPNAACCDL